MVLFDFCFPTEAQNADWDKYWVCYKPATPPPPQPPCTHLLCLCPVCSPVQGGGELMIRDDQGNASTYGQFLNTSGWHVISLTHANGHSTLYDTKQLLILEYLDKKNHFHNIFKYNHIFHFERWFCDFISTRLCQWKCFHVFFFTLSKANNTCRSLKQKFEKRSL